MSKRSNPAWNEQEEASFRPWGDGNTWQTVGWVQLRAGADFTCDGGKSYGLVKDDYQGNKLAYQMLRVQWPNKQGRATFGYVVRKSDTEEVVAVIHQGGGWSWWFKLKDEPEEMQAFHHDDGWVRENLLANTINSVMSWLLK